MAPLVLAATVWLDTTGLHASIHLNNGVVKVVPSSQDYTFISALEMCWKVLVELKWSIVI